MRSADERATVYSDRRLDAPAAGGGRCRWNDLAPLRSDGGSGGFSEYQAKAAAAEAEAVCLNFERKSDGGAGRRNGGAGESGGGAKKRAKASWCNLGRVALVALCVAALCAIAPSAQARHAQQLAGVKAQENETAAAGTETDFSHHRNGYPGGQKKSAHHQSEEIRQSGDSKNDELIVSSEDDVIGRGLVSSSAAVDTSGSAQEVTNDDTPGGDGASVGDDVTRTDVTRDDVTRNEVRPWWMFATTACESWLPPQHIYFQVTFLLVVLACCAPARGSRGCLWLRFMMMASSVALFAWALRGDQYLSFYKSGSAPPHAPTHRIQEATTSSRHTLALSHHQQATTPEGLHHRYQEEDDRYDRHGGHSSKSRHKREQSCRPDALLWAAAVAAINGAHVAFAVCRALRPRRFSGELEEVYQALFKPLKVTRHQFKKVLGCMKMIRSLKYQEVYAQEKVTKVDSLSLVLSGKLVVSQNQRALHIVFPHQFLDSPEWFGVSTDEYFQVSIMSMEESRVLIWHRDKLRLSIITDQFLQAVFDHILGRDVVKKLMQNCQSMENWHGSQSGSSSKSKISMRSFKNVSETMAVSNGYIPNSFDDQSEDKPMLILKKNGDGHGITALINRQLQEEHAPLLSRLCPSSPLVHLTVNPANYRDGTSFEAFDKDERGYWS